MKRILGGGLIIMLCFIACRKIEDPVYQAATGEQTILDVSYGENAKQKMDVYLPANRTTNTNVVVFIHGGSFIGGDKSEFTEHAKYLLKKGFAVFNVNYRLVNGTGVFEVPPIHQKSSILVKDQVDDVNSIVNYIIANSKTLITSDTKIAIAGHSAGGTLALLYAYSPLNQGKVKIVGNFAGATDMVFTDLPNWPTYPAYAFELGYRYTAYPIEVQNEQYYKNISPYHQLNATLKVPVFTAFPQNNEVMGLPKQDFATFNRFKLKLDELKIQNEFLFVADADHNFSNAQNWTLVLSSASTYFNKILN